MPGDAPVKGVVRGVKLVWHRTPWPGNSVAMARKPLVCTQDRELGYEIIISAPIRSGEIVLSGRDSGFALCEGWRRQRHHQSPP